MTVHEARLISVSIDRDWREVYAFAHVPENFPMWASGLASGVERSGEEWSADGPGGRVRIRFAPPNPFGVLDHVVVTAAGERIECPLRVVANGSGAEVTFTLYRRPGVGAEAFAADAGWVARDLAALKTLLALGAGDRFPDERRLASLTGPWHARFLELRSDMEGIPGVPAPIPHSKIAGPHKVRVAGSGSSVASQPANLPIVKVASLSEVASMDPAARAEYIQSIGREATARATAKVIDILV